jgi:nitrate reductase beta subunit
VANADEDNLVQAQRDMMLDPHDPKVIKEAKRNGIAESTIWAAQHSPVYKYVKEWGLALPLHPEFRTLPMLFYVPPMMPVMASISDKDQSEQAEQMDPIAKFWDDGWIYDTSTDEIWAAVEKARIPVQYLASLFTAGDEEEVKKPLRIQLAVRIHRRQETVGDIGEEKVDAVLKDLELTREQCEAIYELTSLPKFEDRFVIPAAHREESMEMLEYAGDQKGNVGFGFKERPARGM